MLIYFLLLYCAIFFNPEVSATGEHEIKRGEYPFMAFLYYPDNKLLDESGSRFLRGAILIHESWLISASIETKGAVHVGYPRKTLLARLGATHIDSNCTLNEDEDEQEREIIEIVRPKHHKRSEWWLTDINLLKTLLPFNLTSTVAITPFRSRPEVMKKCSILVYSSRHLNSTEDKVLMRLHVELYFTRDSCGSYFNADTMICGGENEKNAHGLANTKFCEGNRGSPLICDGDVVGLQTYIEDCKPPYLYNLFFAWDNFIFCGMEEKCSEDKCPNVCTSVYKDEESQKVSPKKAAVHSVSSYFLDVDETKNDTTVSLTNKTDGSPSPTAKTTRLLHSEEDEPTTTISSTITENLNVTASNVTASNTNETQSSNISTTHSMTSRRIFPGYFLETTESSDFNDVPPNTIASTVLTNQTNNTKQPESTSDMTAEAAQEFTTETYVIDSARPERIEGRIDIFNESTARSYTKYETNSEQTPRGHGFMEEDSNESESMELGVSVTPRKPATLGTHHSMMSAKPLQTNGSEVNTSESVTENGNANTETFWPIQKIATIPRLSNNSKHDNSHIERLSRMELQQHRVRGRRYRSSANSNQMWSVTIFFNVLALNCL